MIKRLSGVYKLNDRCVNRAVLNSEVTLLVDGKKFPHVYKDGGFFVLVDLPEGEHTVTLKSWKYQTQELTLNVDYSVDFDEKKSVCHVVMNPSRNHPSAIGAISVSGKLQLSEEKETDFYIMRDRVDFKIAEDSADEGKTEIKLFCSSVKPMLPSTFMIKDKKSDKNEFVVITGMDGETEMFFLDAPLKFSHARSTAVVPMTKCRTDKDGSFYAVMNGLGKTDSDSYELVLMMESGGKTLSKTVNVAKKGETRLDTLKL